MFTVDGRRVGELDEEMVYESRRGEVFLLGATSWRIEDITLDRVIVSPAPGEPGKMPFWHGDRPGRPLELGRAIGAATRELAAESARGSDLALREGFGLDELAAENLAAYLEDQREATGVIPDDRTIVVERFPDELGDWRVCILSPFGARVHAPWAMAIEGRLGERHGLDVQVLWSDDGIAIRLPESEERIPVEDLLFDPDEVEELVVSTAARRRRCSRRRSASRPPEPSSCRDGRPGRRTPLWQQRQRGADLLEVASRHPTFPILLEATRECLRDVFDVPALKEVLGDVRARRIRVVPVDTTSVVAVRAVAAVPVDRGLHVRVRRAAGRAARGGARARPRPAPRAARRRGPARADRSRRARRRSSSSCSISPRNGAPGTPTTCTTCSAGWATSTPRR